MTTAAKETGKVVVCSAFDRGFLLDALESSSVGSQQCYSPKSSQKVYDVLKDMVSVASVFSCLLAGTSMAAMTGFGFLIIAFLQSLPHNRFSQFRMTEGA